MVFKNIKPKKSLGQNFLQDENIARKIVSALLINPNDSILEIGPGTGVLTKYLVQSDADVVAIEIDKKLAKQLEINFSDRQKFKLHQGDFLKINLEDFLEPNKTWKTIGNLPYHITSPVLFKIFENSNFFECCIFMMQKEVAQRIVAQPNCKDYGILSINSQYYAEVKKLFDVSRHVFFPSPKITSSVVKWNFKHRKDLTKEEEQIFRIIVKKVFSQRRKMLRNSLKIITDLEININKLDFDLEQRPEQLSVSDFIELSRQVANQHLV